MNSDCDIDPSDLGSALEYLDALVPAFETFQGVLTGGHYIRNKLYIFDEHANSTMLLLKCSELLICHFKWSAQINEEIAWTEHEYSTLKAFVEDLRTKMYSVKFLLEQEIGSREFRTKLLPSYLEHTRSLIDEADKEFPALERKVFRVFNSGWD